MHKSTYRLSPLEADGLISVLCGQTIRGWEEKGIAERRKNLPASCLTVTILQKIQKVHKSGVNSFNARF